VALWRFALAPMSRAWPPRLHCPRGALQGAVTAGAWWAVTASALWRSGCGLVQMSGRQAVAARVTRACGLSPAPPVAPPSAALSRCPLWGRPCAIPSSSGGGSRAGQASVRFGVAPPRREADRAAPTYSAIAVPRA